MLIVLSGATLYDGIRHLLFVVPALCVFAGVLIAYFEGQNVCRSREIMKAFGAFIALGVVLASVWATTRWIPYSYAFINPIAGWDKSSRSWELDYWGLTAFEGVQRLRQEGLNPIMVLPTEETSTLFGGSAFEEEALRGSAKSTGLYVFLRGDSSLGKCKELFRIERDAVTLGIGGVCK